MGKRNRWSPWMVTLGVLAVPSAATAAEWWYVSTARDFAVFADRSSSAKFQLGGKTLVRLWNATFNSEDDTAAGKYTKDLWYFDCAERSAGLKSYIGYKIDGSVKVSDSNSDYIVKLEPVAPDTVAEAKLVFACNSGMGAGETANFKAEGYSFYFVADLDEAAKLLTPKPSRPAPRPPAKSAPPAPAKRVP